MTNEMMQDLSYNPESDYSMMLFESLIDEAAYNVRKLRRKIYGDVDSSLESLTEMFQDGDFEEGYVSESLQIAYEGALSDLGTKIKRAWEDLKRKCKAFFSRVSESLKNMAARFQAWWTSGRVKADIVLPKSRIAALDAIPEITKVLDKVTLDNLSEIQQKIENMTNAFKNGNSNETDSIPAASVKTHISNLANCLKASSKALSNMDKMISNVTKLQRLGSDTGYDEMLKNKVGGYIDKSNLTNKTKDADKEDFSNTLNHDSETFTNIRKVLTNAMKFMRESITAIASAVKSANRAQKDAEKNKK